jgi:iron complex transport system ATP-binding protein
MGRVAHVGLFSTPSAHDRSVADAALEALEIERLADRLYPEVSGGGRQMTLVARAQEPRLLVMDEPTASLDFGNQVRVLSQVIALARRGMAVIMSTHDPDQAFLCADRAAMLHDGRVIGLGAPGTVITRTSLREIYGVDVDVVTAMSADGRPLRACVPRLRPTLS